MGHQNLSNLLDEEDLKRYHPSDEDLFADLSDFASERDSNKGKFRVKYWIEKSQKRHESGNRILNITEKWLAQNPTINRLEIASVCIREIGFRKDLKILDKYTYHGSSSEVDKIKENTRFVIFKRTLY